MLRSRQGDFCYFSTNILSNSHSPGKRKSTRKLESRSLSRSSDRTSRGQVQMLAVRTSGRDADGTVEQLCRQIAPRFFALRGSAGKRSTLHRGDRFRVCSATLCSKWIAILPQTDILRRYIRFPARGNTPSSRVRKSDIKA